MDINYILGIQRKDIKYVECIKCGMMYFFGMPEYDIEGWSVSQYGCCRACNKEDDNE